MKIFKTIILTVCALLMILSLSSCTAEDAFSTLGQIKNDTIEAASNAVSSVKEAINGNGAETAEASEDVNNNFVYLPEEEPWAFNYNKMMYNQYISNLPQCTAWANHVFKTDRRFRDGNKTIVIVPYEEYEAMVKSRKWGNNIKKGLVAYGMTRLGQGAGFASTGKKAVVIAADVAGSVYLNNMSAPDKWEKAAADLLLTCTANPQACL